MQSGSLTSRKSRTRDLRWTSGRRKAPSPKAAIGFCRSSHKTRRNETGFFLGTGAAGRRAVLASVIIVPEKLRDLRTAARARKPEPSRENSALAHAANARRGREQNLFKKMLPVSSLVSPRHAPH